MKKFNLALFSLLIVFVLVSCSKEKKIERSLYKKGGEWNINSQKFEIYNDGQLSLSNSSINSGTINFSKKGTLV
jgi:hypothetical protein|tara:strand:+ start:10310 stop:10531 length:222 start_codon:yes stop_codon:yes gene_type:complete